jgi:hypothetical protein
VPLGAPVDRHEGAEVRLASLFLVGLLAVLCAAPGVAAIILWAELQLLGGHRV